MPNKICKKCNNLFNYQPIIDGKKRNLNNRKYCFDCSPFNNHNTSQLDKIKKIRQCEDCKIEYIYNRFTGEKFSKKCKKCYSIHYNKISKQNKKLNHRQKRKIKIVQYLGGECKICGYKKCIQALDVHHINPEEKLFNISGNHCFSWEKVQKELNKCILLCANCHREFHAGLVKLPPIG